MQLKGRRVVAAMCACMGMAGCKDPVTLDPVVLPSRYITAKRAWLPGERDSVVARILANNSLVLPYVGNISDLAPDILADLESVTVIVPNPLYPAAAVSSPLNFRLTPPTDASWSVTGLQLLIDNDAVVPRDTLAWVGVFWFKIGEETWKGMVVNSQTDSVFAAVAVRTQNFEPGKSGAGGGEARASTGEYWEADNSGDPRTIQIDSAFYGAYATVASGVFQGADRRTGTVKGRINNVRMPREIPNNTGFINVDLDFRTTAIPAISIRCNFPVPCIGEQPLSAGRRGSLP